ncbi:RNA polymerase sigma factor [Salimicrobium halophilum]|uniref:RNA polymerase sigma-70 factor, ECF subfamily n=1 Tax=Salimicrobium halophilum TaxID=86666 RepID=A0A1G8USZ4_9BACI|nr:RNA polymerase sigma factor [Salimicrobium halophilum]SDJ56996.1 RNA polymerase sigma-70 factor, ECF subfamily [Salimicrobium halophilum]
MFDKEGRLLRKAKKGDQRAFKKIYDKYAGYALRTAYAITKNDSDASDVVQETFIKVYRHLDSYDPGREFKPWFYRILLNESRRLLAKRKKREIPAEDELFERAAETSGDTGVREILDELDEHHRTVLTLKYLEGFSEKEIADLLELNVNTVKSRLFKARKKMRERIGGADDE